MSLLALAKHWIHYRQEPTQYIILIHPPCHQYDSVYTNRALLSAFVNVHSCFSLFQCRNTSTTHTHTHTHTHSLSSTFSVFLTFYLSFLAPADTCRPISFVRPTNPAIYQVSLSCINPERRIRRTLLISDLIYI